MIITYDIEVLPQDWIMVFKVGNDYRVIHNNVKELEAYIAQNRFKFGFFRVGSL